MSQRLSNAARYWPWIRFCVAIALALQAWLGLAYDHKTSAEESIVQQVTDADKAAVAEGVRVLTVAFKEKRFGDMIATIPPRVLEVIAGEAKVDIAQVRVAMQEMLEKSLEIVTVDAFAIDLADTEYKTLPSGEPYMLIPTHVEMTADTAKTTVDGSSLAFRDNGVWYIMRVETKQLPMLLEAYPQFKGVDLPKERMEVKQ